MDYYVVQVRAGNETAFKQNAGKKKIADTNDYNYSVIFPQRVLKIRKAGVVSEKLMPVFPGYVFIEMEKHDQVIFQKVRKLKGFFRFLPNNVEPQALSGRDLDILSHFMGFGCVAKISKAMFDENDRIQILEGPLMGLEGKIIKVDKRKGRAKIKLDMFSNSFSIDLGFETISSITKNKEVKNGKIES